MAGIDLYIAGGLTVTDESMKNIHGVCMKDIKKKKNDKYKLNISAICESCFVLSIIQTQNK